MTVMLGIFPSLHTLIHLLSEEQAARFFVLYHGLT